jgi:hypothetical protein
VTAVAEQLGTLEDLDEAPRRHPFAKYRPFRQQRVFHALRTRLGYRVRAVKAGRRGGKTLAAAYDFTDTSLRDHIDRSAGRGRYEHLGPAEFAGWKGSDPEPFLHYWVVAPTYELLGEPKRYLQAAFGRESEGGLIQDQDRSAGVWRLRGGIRIDFRSAERPTLLVSRGLDGVWGDEVARWKEDVWQEHVRPALADHCGWATMTTTPLGRNWFWRELWCPGDPVEAEIAAEEGEEVPFDPQFACVEWHTADNTAVPGLAAEVEAASRTMPKALVRRSFFADFDAFKGQVFDLDRQVHLSRAVWLPSAFDRGVVAGYDQGSNHPGVLTVWGCRSVKPYFVELETTSRRRRPVTSDQGDDWRSDFARVRRTYGPIRIFLPADASEAENAAREVGLRVAQAYQTRIAGVQWWSMVLHDASAVFTSARTLARWSKLKHPDGYGSGSELWVKEDDDEFDAARYALSDWIRGSRLPGRRRVGLVKQVIGR